MVRLVWDAHGERYFEGGADRGVLYVSGKPGVPWNGLKAVNETSVESEAKPFYLEGYKYLNLAAAGEFAATIEAFYSPGEFDLCDGTAPVYNGLAATQQPRKKFGLSYRTLVGNDFDGIDHAYKIHLVYNALATPSPRNNQTLGGAITPMDFQWNLTTQPPLRPNIRPTAHFVIDSRETPPELLAQIENILYGSSPGPAARLPELDEIMDIFLGYGSTGYGTGVYGISPPYGY